MHSPYAVAADAYLTAGFSPLPANGKTLIVSGFSGYEGKDVEPHNIARWKDEYPDANILLRLPDNVIGLDIDDYKGNVEDLAKLEEQYGKLPTTFNADSRGGTGGKLLFRVPMRSAKWKSEIGGITVIQRSHRYVLAPPSFNPHSQTFVRWYFGLGGPEILDEVPYVIDLPMLPDNWVNALLITDMLPVRMLKSCVTPDELYEHFNQGEPCPFMQRLHEQCDTTLRTAFQNGLHDAALHVIGKVFSAGRFGHTGVQKVIESLGETFASAPRGRDLESEWLAAVEYVAYRVDINEIDPLDHCTIKLIFPGKTKKEPTHETDLSRLRAAGFSSSQARYMIRR